MQPQLYSGSPEPEIQRSILMAKNNKPHGKLVWKILCGVFAFLFAFLMIGGPIANNYASIINMVLGIEGS